MNSRRNGFEFGEGDEFLAAHLLEAGQEGEIEGRETHGGGRHLVDEMHQRAHAGARDRVLRREAHLQCDLIEIFGDHGRIDDNGAVMVKCGHDAIRIELEIIGLELVAGEQIELHLVEVNLLGLEHKTNPLAAG